MTRTIVLFVVMLYINLTLISFAFAEPQKIVFKVGNQNYSIDDANLYTEIVPFVYDGCVYVPVRYLAQALGVDVKWEEYNKEIIIKRDNINISLKEGSNLANINKNRVFIDASVKIVPPGRTFLPARFIAESFGYKVEWNDKYNEVIIEKSNFNSEQPSKNPSNDAKIPIEVQQGPFNIKLKTLELEIGNSVAYINSDRSLQIVMSCQPKVIVVNQDKRNRVIGLNNRLYEQHPPVIDSSLLTVTGDGVVAPIVPVLQALGLPSENIGWDGTTLKLYKNTDEYIEISINKSEYIIKGPNTLNFLYTKPKTENNTILITLEDIEKIVPELFRGKIKANYDLAVGKVILEVK